MSTSPPLRRPEGGGEYLRDKPEMMRGRRVGKDEKDDKSRL